MLDIDDVVATADGSTATFVFHPLTLTQDMTLEPRPCLEAFGYSGVEVDTNGNFELDMGLVMVPGGANPITGGDIVFTAVVLGQTVEPDAMCGVVDGMLTSPLEYDLVGSAFAAIRLADDGCTPETLPTTFPYKCSML